MTERLYYTDSMQMVFEATVAYATTVDGRHEVVLDRTAFYPTSGGQPHDMGRLIAGGSDARVLDVVDRDDHEVVHVVSSPVAVGARVRGEVDWARRFDHMQQHTGQHVLSAAFERTAHARTVSFHLGVDSATIDLAREVTPAEIAEAERVANDIVWSDVEVTVTFATEEDARLLPLRKDPARTGLLRLVKIGDADLSACGGTHVPRSGMVGAIAVGGWERFKGGSRVQFVCGGRAVAAHTRLRDIVASAMRLTSVSAAELPATIERMQQERKAQSRALRQLQEEIAGQRGHAMRSMSVRIGALSVVLRDERGWDAGALKMLAAAVVAEPGFVAILAGDGQPTPVVAARSTDVSFDAAAWMSRATAALGGRGGGRPELAQGGLMAPAERVLAWARESLA